MKKLLLTSCLALGLTSGLFADTITATSVNGGAATGSVRLNLNGLGLLSAVPQSAGGLVSVQGTGDAGVVSGASANQYAAPVLSVNNGQGFGPGGTDQANGVDTTKYLSTGVGSITFNFSSPLNYFGLLWGSVDDYNLLEFYDAAWNLVGSVTGTQVKTLAASSVPFGDQTADGTFYVNIYNTTIGGTFSHVKASSTEYAFEIDNIAYNVASVPDASATVALLGLSLVCLVSFRRKTA